MAPVITVIGNNPSEVAVGASYVDLGATVTDNVNNNLGISYAVDGVNVSNITIGTSIDATFIVTYSATDQVGNTGVATRTVIVGTGVTETTPEPTATTTPEAVVTLDTTAPVITIVGNNPVTVELNSVYIDEGATATDDTDGDITSSIIAINSVDTTTVGTYTVVYNVTDQVGNNAVEVTREVTVEDTTPVAPIATSTSSQ
ncbi:DUF5011 domain-containing protein [Candidatus Kaiserbacteria bacterium]|nr:DUF5011 domain-containing protein [Candidatus Kaiserbacteria bacterium]